MKPGTTGVQRLAKRQRRRQEQHMAAPISGGTAWGRGLRNNGLKKKCAEAYKSLLVHMRPVAGMTEFKSPQIHRTPLYRAKAAYANMKRRCSGGNDCANNPTYKNVHLRMTMEEWLTWAVPEYTDFIKKNPNERPAAARLGDVGDYEIGNIKIISSKQNKAEAKTLLHITKDGKKMCSKCRTVKPVSCYNKNKSQKWGLNHWCIECCRPAAHADYLLRRFAAAMALGNLDKNP